VRETWRGLLSLGILKDMHRKALETDVFVHRVPIGEHCGDAPLPALEEKGEILFYQKTLFTGESQRVIKEGCGKGHLPP